MARTLSAGEAKERLRSAMAGAGRRSALVSVEEAKAAFREAASRQGTGAGRDRLLTLLLRTGTPGLILEAVLGALVGTKGR